MEIRSIHTPSRPLDPTGARARRSLAASQAARNGISNMVDALRISKPPRAPQKSLPSTVARRHALIPLAEGRQELEARIRALEDTVANRDAEMLKLKKQLGRALVKRRHIGRERDQLSARLGAAMSGVKQAHANAVAARADLATVVEDVMPPLDSMHACLKDARGIEKPVVSEMNAALDDVTSALDIAQRKLAHPLEEFTMELPPQTASAISLGRVRPVRPASTVGSDDDTKSCTSFASSNAFGEDRDGQLDTLVELVEVLEAKLSRTPPHPAARSALSRAKKTIADSTGTDSELVAERDRLRATLDAITKERETGDGEDAALVQAARARTERDEARGYLEDMRQRLVSLEKIAEKSVKQEERNLLLEGELRDAKKTVARLVQERNSVRRSTPNTPISATASFGRTRRRPAGDPDALKRILDWRQKASNENKPPSQPLPDDDDDTNVILNRKNGQIERKEPLPDRGTADLTRPRSPMKKMRTGYSDAESGNVNDSHSVSESLEGGLDSSSAHSIPVQGFLKRHDSFISAGGASASNDEITITNNRNLFGNGAPKVDGLRGLLGGSGFVQR